MKKVLLVIAGLLALASSVSAQNSTSIQPIMKSGMEFVKDIESKYGDKAIIVKSEFDFAFDDNLTFVDMSSKITYVIGAMGDANVTQITVIVMKNVDGQWVKIQSKVAETNEAVVEIDPSADGEYAIDVQVTKYKTDSKIGHVALFIIAVPK